MKDNKKTEYNKIEDAIFVHRLKHGLAAIKWSLKMILSGDFGEISDEQKDIIEKSLEDNEKLILLSDNLLNGTDVDKTKKFLSRDLCDAELIVNSVIKSYESKIAEKKIKLEFTAPEEKTEIFLDKEKIKIAIQNILDNAIRYTKEGGKIVISLSRNQGNVELKIQDSGMGIPENQKRKLFTKFFRGDNAIKVNDDGSGLGLFIAKNIIEAHGGKIWFESEENKGSTFYVALPIDLGNK
jgi:signal transduction histidine kinase